MSRPKVSVLMPAYNAEEYIGEAIESVLNQTFGDFEFLIVDDASTDRTAEIAAGYAERDGRIRLERNRYGKGIVGALNTGLELARGEYVARMDADDRSRPERLDKQIRFMDINPEIGVCGSWIRTFGRFDGTVVRLPAGREAIAAMLLFGSPLAHPTAVMRSSVLERSELRYSQTFGGAEDYDLWARALEAGVQIANVQEVLLDYRTFVKDERHEKMQGDLAAAIRSGILKRTVPGISESEIALHETIVGLRQNHRRLPFGKVWAWRRRLLDGNRTTGVFDRSALSAQSAKRILGDWLFCLVRPVGKPASAILRRMARRLRQGADWLWLQVRRPFLFPMASEIPDRPKIGFAVLSHERPEYLEMCLDSLFRTDLAGYDVTFLISDDGSADPRVREIIDRPRDGKYRIVRKFWPKGHNSWAGGFNRAMRCLLDEIGGFDVVGTCDSDCLFHPDWLRKTMEICVWAKRNHRKRRLGPFSSFNSSDAGFHGIVGTFPTPYGNFVVKKRMGALNYLYFVEDFRRLGFFEESPDDETLMTERFRKLGVRNFCTETSYVEHLGQDSVLNRWRPIPVRRAVFGLNLAKGDWGTDMEKASPYGFYRFLKEDDGFRPGEDVSSDWPVDVFIPAIGKDLPVLPHVVSSVRRNLRHPVGRIMVAAPPDREIVRFCRDSGCEFIDERTVLPIGKEGIDYRAGGLDRSGWLFQQLLKLGCDLVSDAEHVYVIDADTVLAHPQKFEHGGKPILLVSDEFHFPYRESYGRLFGYPAEARFSFVAHQMLFGREALKGMRAEIESKNPGKRWFEAIVGALDRNEASSFSEYETYGNWMMRNRPGAFLVEHFRNCAMPRKALKASGAGWPSGCRSVSFHDYDRHRLRQRVLEAARRCL